MTREPLDYAVGQKVVHWLMAFLIILDLFVAQKFGREMAQADRFESRTDHSQVGTIIAILLVIRLFLRWRHGAPALPAGMPDWQLRLAKLTHGAFYGLIGLLIATGILSAYAADSAVTPFGVLAYGDGTARPALWAAGRTVHVVATNALITLIGLHLVAAAYHLVIKRDGSTRRMLRFWRSQRG